LRHAYPRRIDADAAPFEIEVRVIPRARRNEVGGTRAGRLLVRTTAAPVDDKANAAVCRLVAAYLEVRERDVEVVAGHRSRDKTLRVAR
jgi:uncharacterized protein YggU (UPF0235/DUF167 family)